MAINVNDVYQTVLFILNKEQRGYMTPAEFNQVASQVQQSIFEKYFEDLNFYLRTPVVASEYADRIKTLEEKIAEFETEDDINVNSTITGKPYSSFLLAPNSTTAAEGTTNDVHRLGTLSYISTSMGNPEIELQQSTVHELNHIKRSKLTAPTLMNPVYVLQDSNEARVYPNTISTINAYYIKKPVDPIWAFNIGSAGQYEFVKPGSSSAYPNSAAGSVNFEISDQDKTEVVLGVLMYAGVIIRDPQIVGAAERALQQEEVTEKS